MTVSRIWNLWVQDVNTEHRDKSQRTFITSSREDRNVIRMKLLVRAAGTNTPRPSQELGAFTRQQVSLRPVR
ncbi:hypothetical protein TNCV_4076601 [Trichonephila clavipes]|nr:hypothetical protein TNCV_4076601 [Trichonephila clavipes]